MLIEQRGGYNMAVSFKDHMKDRAFMMDRCSEVIIGKDFAVFEFENKFDRNKVNQNVYTVKMSIVCHQ